MHRRAFPAPCGKYPCFIYSHVRMDEARSHRLLVEAIYVRVLPPTAAWTAHPLANHSSLRLEACCARSKSHRMEALCCHVAVYCWRFHSPTAMYLCFHPILLGTSTTWIYTKSSTSAILLSQYSAWSGSIHYQPSCFKTSVIRAGRSGYTSIPWDICSSKLFRVDFSS